MKFTAKEVLYRIGQDAVTIVLENELGGLTNVDSTQSALQARASAGIPWGDTEVVAESLAGVAARFPGTHTVEPFAPPTPKVTPKVP